MLFNGRRVKVVEGEEDTFQLLGERIDQLISLDVASRNVIHMLFEASRIKLGQPLAMAAARLLHTTVRPGDYVFISTGWPDRPHVTPEIAETDGPPGAVALARALHFGLGAIPVILIEDNLVSPMEKVFETSGLRSLTPEEAMKAYHYHAAIHAGAVLGFSNDYDTAKRQAKQLLQQYKPTALVFIEKGGRNALGEIHTSRGAETTRWMAKADALLEESYPYGIATIGIGDGGNEIGMGNIKDYIKENIPYGNQCKCDCRGGIAPVNEVDILVAASISNWGAYGVSAALAALCRNINVMHDGEIEERMLKRSSEARFIDGITGLVDPSADGLRWTIHTSFVNLLRETVIQALRSLGKNQ